MSLSSNGCVFKTKAELTTGFDASLLGSTLLHLLRAALLNYKTPIAVKRFIFVSIFYVSLEKYIVR
jgi:hypothetical protein